MAANRYRLVIGNKTWSSWSLRPWLAMRRAGLPFDEINVRLRQPDTKAQILKHSPSGMVPTRSAGPNPTANIPALNAAVMPASASSNTTLSEG